MWFVRTVPTHLLSDCVLFLCVLIPLFHSLLYSIYDKQEVNLSNNQLSELPPLWASIWGCVDLSTGLLTLTVTTASATEKDNNEAKGAKVLLLGNPIMTSTE